MLRKSMLRTIFVFVFFSAAYAADQTATKTILRRRELQQTGCVSAPTILPVHIISDYSKLVLRANPDGAVVQSFGSSRDDDNWVLVAAGSGLYRVVIEGTNKAMSIVGGAADDGIGVEVTTSSFTDGRDKWCLRIVANTNGSYLLENAKTKKIVDVAGFSQLNGAKIHQWTNVGGTNQRWTFSIDTDSAYVPAWECIGFSTDASYKIVAKHSSKVLAVVGSAQAGAKIQQNSVAGLVNEWKLVSTNNGFYHITEPRSGLAMKVVGGTQDGTNVILSTPTQGVDDDWCFMPLGNSLYEIRNRETGKCIDVSGISMADGALIHQWGYLGGDNQKFSMVSPSTAPIKSPTSAPIAQINPPLVHSLWQGPIKTPVIAAAAASLPDGRIVMWAAKNRIHFAGSEGAQTWTAMYDPSTGSLTEQVVLTNHDMFCPGTSLLSNGVLMISGGSSSSETTFFDYRINQWSVGPKLNLARGYHTQTVLATGDVLTVGGSWSGSSGGKRDGEVWNPRTNVWRTLSNMPSLPLQTADREGTYRSDNHYWLFLAPNGKVFHAGPSKQMHWLTTLNNGSIEVSIVRGDDTDAMNGNAVMYDIGKLLTLGGAANYGTGAASNRAYVIDISNSSNNAVTVKRSGNVNFARSLCNSVVLPNGEVVVIGGQTMVELFSDNNAVLDTEIWNPLTGRFTTLQKTRIPRTYHSVALLMKDGRVWTAGGGLCGGCSSNHQDYEILSPPYLFNADGTLAIRPVITILSPKQTKAGEIIKVTVDTVGIYSFALVRTSAVTHSVNNDQRRIPLSIISNINREYLLGIPSNKNVALTGVYYLFAMNNGVPSIGKDLEIAL